VRLFLASGAFNQRCDEWLSCWYGLGLRHQALESDMWIPGSAIKYPWSGHLTTI
jgi:hypothetical protein